jgi:hypothetical protein
LCWYENGLPIFEDVLVGVVVLTTSLPIIIQVDWNLNFLVFFLFRLFVFLWAKFRAIYINLLFDNAAPLGGVFRVINSTCSIKFISIFVIRDHFPMNHIFLLVLRRVLSFGFCRVKILILIILEGVRNSSLRLWVSLELY